VARAADACGGALRGPTFPCDAPATVYVPGDRHAVGTGHPVTRVQWSTASDALVLPPSVEASCCRSPDPGRLVRSLRLGKMAPADQERVTHCCWTAHVSASREVRADVGRAIGDGRASDVADRPRLRLWCRCGLGRRPTSRPVTHEVRAIHRFPPVIPAPKPSRLACETAVRFKRSCGHRVAESHNRR
jgi:hypothetical protein